MDYINSLFLIIVSFTIIAATQISIINSAVHTVVLLLLLSLLLMMITPIPFQFQKEKVKGNPDNQSVTFKSGMCLNTICQE